MNFSLSAQIPVPDSTTKKHDQILQVAYGTQPSWMISGSLSSVSGDDLEKSFTSNLANALYGRLPGLTVSQAGNEPGFNSPVLNARGINTYGTGRNMLILVDGFESSFEVLNAAEIESIVILKDASATAIYGSRGANGVLLVTTKRGKEGSLVVNFSTQQGIQNSYKLPEFLNSYNYASLYNEALANDGKPPLYSTKDLEAYKSGSDPYFHPNVNWYDEVLRKSASMRNYSLSFRGGNNSVKYFGFFNALNSQNLFKRTGDMSENSINGGYKRYNFRTNVDINLTKRLAVSLTLGGAFEDRSNPSDSTTASVFSRMASIAPNAFPVRNPNGTFGGNSLYTNPLGDISETGFFTSNARTLQSNIKFTEQLDFITPGLSISGSLALNSYFIGYSNKTKTYARYSLSKDNLGNIVYNKIGQNTSLVGNESLSAQKQSFAFNGFLNYNRSFGKNKIDGVFMYLASHTTTFGENLPYKYLGGGGRITFTNNDKYIAEYAFGYMGSENFAKGKRFGFFPAASLGWVISNESFLKDNSVINYLKLRASYGLTGNDQIGGQRFMYSEVFNFSNAYYLGDANTSIDGIEEIMVSNPNVTWEKEKKFNIGLEATLFKRLDFGLDIFSQTRYDILTKPYQSIPGFWGMIRPDINLGKVSNKGFETTVRLHSLPTKKLGYFIELSAWYAKNSIDYNSEAIPAEPWLARTGNQIDQPFVLEAIGFYKDQADILASPKPIFANVQPGDIKYKDRNNDNIIDQNDFYPIGNTDIPNFTAALNMGLNYKGFDVVILMQAVTGRTVYLSGNYFQAFQNNGKISSFALDRWTPETASTANYPRLSSENNLNNFQPSSFWQRDGSFIKFRYLEVGYTLSEKLIRKVQLSSARVFLNGTNLFSLDHIDFTDPETLSGYPAMRTISMGFRLQF